MQYDPKQIEAYPTKELFISVLVRDIPLIRAIIDLVDNSLDGARRIRQDGNYNGLWVRIELDKDYFKISDNCGGIPVDIARDFAFRFGRPKKAPETPGSIGQFGVGMKRTFFKLGKIFEVRSYTANSFFSVEENVDEWIKNENDWHFKFKELEENLKDVDTNNIGTEIKITLLLENISKEFDLSDFKNQLSRELSEAHSISMDKGLAISLNGIPSTIKPMDLLDSEDLKPVFFKNSYQYEGKPSVNVKIYAGIAERNISEGGWYVFCNGRMLLEADQSINTGWGEGKGNTIPKYHADFAYFRGYVFFDCDDAGLLPWTTTKTGVDIDSSVFKSVRLKMLTLTRPILDYLRALATEKKEIDDGVIESDPLNTARKEAELTKYSELKINDIFVSPDPAKKKKKPGPKEGVINYSQPQTKIDQLKTIMKVNSNRAVGIKTFKYYIEMEGVDE